MKAEPRIEHRPEQRYLGTRAVMPMSDFDRQIPAMTTQVAAQLAAKGLQATGKPFLRYHVIDMPQRMDVELGIPVDDVPHVDRGVDISILPAGLYAVLAYTGAKNGVAANKKLLDWIAAQGEAAARHDSELGEVFDARHETFLVDGSVEPEPEKWQFEVAIKLRD